MKALVVAIIGASFALTAATRAADAPQNFVIHETAKPLPSIQFVDGSGQFRSLADFHGKVLLVNIWATWCAPCRREMPTLDRLQATLGGANFAVVALSIDRAGPGVVRKFFGEIGVGHLALYIDSTGQASRDLAAVGLPTTLLVDTEGRELGRLVGPAEWDAPDMVAFLRSRLPGKPGALRAEVRRAPYGDTAIAMRRRNRLAAGSDFPISGSNPLQTTQQGMRR